MVLEFCREAIEKLQNWEKYNTQVFNFEEWEKKQIDRANQMLLKSSESNLDIRSPLEEEVPDDGNYVTNEVLREWAHGKRTLVISNQDYQISLANFHADKNDVFQRMTLCAEMISDPQVPNNKKLIFLNILYERLWMGLWAVNRQKAREFNIEHGQQTLEWCTSHCKDSYHPAVQEFCKNAKEVLTNWDTYNDSVFDYRKWEHEQIMSAHEKWLPLEDTN